MLFFVDQYQVTTMMRWHNLKFTHVEVEQLTHIAFGEVTPQCWKSLIAHVQEKVEDHYWEANRLQMELVEEFIISLERGTDSDSDSSDTSDSYSSDEAPMQS